MHFKEIAQSMVKKLQPPPIEMLPKIKMSQKDYCFFSFSFFNVLEYNSTGV